MSRWSTMIVLALTLCTLATFSVTAVSAAVTGEVRVGDAPTLPAHATAVGVWPGAARLHVAVTLEPRDSAALAAYATAVATPGSALYRHYLTVAQFAQQFGPTPAQIAAVQSSLRAQGLDPGPVSSNGLAIPVDATAAQLAHAFSIGFERVALPGGRTAVANTAAPSLAAGAAGYVQGVVGLDSLGAPQPLGIARARSQAAAPVPTPHVVTGGPQPCAAASSAAASNPVIYTADQLASAYGLSSLYGAGDEGAGETVALYELEPNAISDISAYQTCYGTSTSVSYAPVDGGAGTGPGSGESALDIEDVIGLAPTANIIVYQGPNNSGSGPYDTYLAMISQDRAKVISTSWGLCEPQEGSSSARAESALFQEAAAQGQTIVAAAGDSGSTDCGGHSLAVDDPGSQPFITSVGGTSLNALGTPPSETVWNGGCSSACGGGGGISSLWPMPSYQSAAPRSLNVINQSSSGSPCHAASGSYCREVPDVSAAANPSTGYLIHFKGSWGGIGGTSASAPLWAALVALGNASTACNGTPIGFLNPSLYSVAGSDYANAFNDVSTGNNDITGTLGGLFMAGPGYDMASGLGTPTGAALTTALCHAATSAPPPSPATTPAPTPPATSVFPVALASPGNQTARVGETQRLQIAASAGGEKLTYAAAALPTGLSIDSATGVISGTPRTPGVSTVTVYVTDSSAGSARTVFLWTIGGLPAASGHPLLGLASGRIKLAFTVRAGQDAPGIKAVVVGLPRGLRFVPSVRRLAHSIVVEGPGAKQLKFAAALAPGALRITLGAVTTLKVTVAFPAIRVSAGLAAKAKRHRVKALMVAIAITDASNQTTTVMLALRG